MLKSCLKQVDRFRERQGKATNLHSINFHLDREIEGIDDAFHATDRTKACRGISTGIEQLDMMCDGLHPAEVTLISGRPDMGVSEFSLQIAANAAIFEGKPVAYFSLNLSSERLTRKLISLYGEISSHDLVRGVLEEDDFPKLARAVNIIKDTPLYFDDSISIDYSELSTKATQIIRENQIELIVIDSFQQLAFNSRDKHTASDLAFALSGLARKLSVPIVITSSVTSEIEKRPNKRPMISDLSNWGSLSECVDSIIFLYKDEIYNETTDYIGQTEVTLAKNSTNGPIGSFFATQSRKGLHLHQILQ